MGHFPKNVFFKKVTNQGEESAAEEKEHIEAGLKAHSLQKRWKAYVMLQLCYVVGAKHPPGRNVKEICTHVEHINQAIAYYHSIYARRLLFSDNDRRDRIYKESSNEKMT